LAKGNIQSLQQQQQSLVPPSSHFIPPTPEHIMGRLVLIPLLARMHSLMLLFVAAAAAGESHASALSQESLPSDSSSSEASEPAETAVSSSSNPGTPTSDSTVAGDATVSSTTGLVWYPAQCVTQSAYSATMFTARWQCIDPNVLFCAEHRTSMMEQGMTELLLLAAAAGCCCRCCCCRQRHKAAQ
jgi:hypothetical protein